MNLKKIFLNDKVINRLIIINSIVIFLLLFNEIPIHIRIGLVLFDWLFNIFFISECFYKIFNTKKYFKNISNIFDFSLVLLLLISIIVNDYCSVSNFYIIRIIRLWKSTKLFKLIPNYQRIINNVKIASRTCFELLIGIVIIIFIMSLIFTTIYSDVSAEYFGNPLKSMYSIFRILTLEGWYEIPNSLTETENYFNTIITKTLFSVIVLIGSIFGISFITSIVTDELSSDNNDNVLEELKTIKEEIKKLQR